MEMGMVNGRNSRLGFDTQNDLRAPTAEDPLLRIDSSGNGERELRVRQWKSSLGLMESAVTVRKACKKYESQNVLNNFNMTVPRNSIYGLLGSSGSGKTTILTAIVGLRSLDSGQISICGYPTGSIASGVPGKRVGYMPQEIALNGEFLINEVLQYFGRIYGMSLGQIDERCSYLVKLLSLEKCRQTLIRNMSDGQKRRVSLAVTLLHEPEILILDEPTVGCDPLLRQTIWNFLNEVVANKKATVIVTTHYIEETRQADKIGVIRNGRLLVEDAPSNLLSRYNVTLLDDIVLKLCEKDEAEGGEDNNGTSDTELEWDVSYQEGELPLKAKTETTIMTSNEGEIAFTTLIGNRLWALLIKNLLVLGRNLWFLTFLLTLPGMIFFLFVFVIGSEPTHLRVGVINGEGASAVCPMLPASVSRSVSCVPANLSCIYLDSIDKQKIRLVSFESDADALRQVELQQLWGFVTFDKDFSNHMFARHLLGKRNNVTVQKSQIRIRLDMANSGVALKLKKELYDAFRIFSKRLLTSCGVNPFGRDFPVTFESPIYGSEDPHVAQFIAPGFSLGANFFGCALACGLTYLVEKKDGMINRTLVAGANLLEIILSHFILQFVIVIPQIVISLTLLTHAFDVHCLGSSVLAFLAILISCVAGMSLGFMAATFCSEEKNAMLLAVGTFFPSFLLAGVIWPIESAPIVIQWMSVIVPGTQIAEAYRSIIHRGLDISHSTVWAGFVACAAWICVYWAIIIVHHRLSRRN